VVGAGHAIHRAGQNNMAMPIHRAGQNNMAMPIHRVGQNNMAMPSIVPEARLTIDPQFIAGMWGH